MPLLLEEFWIEDGCFSFLVERIEPILPALLSGSLFGFGPILFKSGLKEHLMFTSLLVWPDENKQVAKNYVPMNPLLRSK